MKTSALGITPPQIQRGMVLMTTVMLMVVLTIVVISLMRTTILDERMVANSRDWNNAFQAAEAALRDGEREVILQSRIRGVTNFVTGCSSAGLCLPNTCTSSSDCTPIWVDLAASQNDAGWKTGSGSSKSVAYGTYSNATALPGLGAQPRYIVEALTVVATEDTRKIKASGQSTSTYYRITAVGFGVNTGSRVMLQSVVRPNS